MNNRLILIGLLSGIIMTFGSCESDSCFKSEGDPKVLQVLTSDYDTLYIDGIFNVILIEDTNSYIEFEGGENQLANVRANLDGTHIHLENQDDCFLHPEQSKIDAYVHFRSLLGLHINSPCKLTSETPLTTLKYVYVHQRLAEVDIELDRTGFYLYNIPAAAGIYKLRGYVDRCKLAIYYTPKCDFEHLMTRELIVENRSVGDLKVNASEMMIVRIFNRGNIYYSGSPEIIIDTIAGTGQLLPWK